MQGFGQHPKLPVRKHEKRFSDTIPRRSRRSTAPRAFSPNFNGENRSDHGCQATLSLLQRPLSRGDVADSGSILQLIQHNRLYLWHFPSRRH